MGGKLVEVPRGISRQWFLALFMALIGLGAASCAQGGAVSSQAGFERVRSFAAPYSVQHLAATPDGSLLATANAILRGPLLVWDTATGKLRYELDVVNSGGLLGFTRDGRFLITDPHMRQRDRPGLLASVFDVQAGKWVGELLRPEGGGGAAMNVAVSPAGDELAITWGNKYVSIFDVGSWRRVAGWQTAGDRTGYTGMAYSPDGRVLALGTLNGEVELHDRSAGRLMYRVHAHKARVEAIAFAPDGRFVTTSEAQDHRVSDRMPREKEVIKLWKVGDSTPEDAHIEFGPTTVQDAAFLGSTLIAVSLIPTFFDVNEGLNLDAKMDIRDVFAVEVIENCFAFGRRSLVEIWCKE